MLFLTAHSDEIDSVVGLELGADDYIARRFSPRELVARMRTILRPCKHCSTRDTRMAIWTPMDSDIEKRLNDRDAHYPKAEIHGRQQPLHSGSTVRS